MISLSMQRKKCVIGCFSKNPTNLKNSGKIHIQQSKDTQLQSVCETCWVYQFIK